MLLVDLSGRHQVGGDLTATELAGMLLVDLGGQTTFQSITARSMDVARRAAAISAG